MDEETVKKTLFINHWNSRCGNCGRDADPGEKSHVTPMGYGRPPEGCHMTWEFVSSDYTDGNGLHEAIKAMRPDLKFWFDSIG